MLLIPVTARSFHTVCLSFELWKPRKGSLQYNSLVPLHRGFDRLAPEAVRSGKGCSRQNGARDEGSARITQEDQAWDQTNDLMAHLASTGQNLCAEVLDLITLGTLRCVFRPTRVRVNPYQAAQRPIRAMSLQLEMTRDLLAC